MKIGILTIFDADNYGAVLQALALQTCIEKTGYECEIINYATVITTPRFYGFSLRPRAFLWFMERFLRRLGSEEIKRYRFRKFRKEFLKCSEYYPHASSINSRKYAGIVVGSDQVWNPRINRGDRAYLLHFVEQGVPKIAYAPSFGGCVLTTEEAGQYLNELSTFTALSCRENEGARLIEALTDQTDVPVVLDPTLLLTASDYVAFEMTDDTANSGRYILCYYVGFFSPRSELVKSAEHLSRKTGLPVRYISNEVYTSWTRAFHVRSPSPGQFLFLIKHADYVVTNSFHGSVFSIIYHRELFCCLSGSANTRMKTLFSLLGVHERLFSEADELKRRRPVQPIDFRQVEEFLRKLREISWQYLDASLQGTQGKPK